MQVVIELSQKTQVAPEDRPNDIPVRTILGAKGLEAPVVFLVSAIPQSFTRFGSVADGIRREASTSQDWGPRWDLLRRYQKRYSLGWGCAAGSRANPSGDPSPDAPSSQSAILRITQGDPLDRSPR